MNIPSELKSLRGWLTWRYVKRADEGKPRKVPYYSNGAVRRGRQGSPEDRAQLATFEEATAAAKSRNMQGVGLALLPEWGIVGLDFDNCIVNTGSMPEIMPAVTQLIDGTYAELSPSGKGVRAFYLGNAGDHKAAANDLYPFGYETFSSRGFLTITGNSIAVDDLAGPYLATLPEKVRQHCRERFGEGFDRARSVTKPDPDREPTPIAEVRALLFKQDPDCIEPQWRKLLAAVHYATMGSEEGFKLADEWSATGKKYKGSHSVRDKWNRMRLDVDNPVTLASLVTHGVCENADDFTDYSNEQTAATKADPADKEQQPATGPLDAFYAHLPDHRYIHRPTGALWPAASIDSKFKGLKFDGNISPTTWLDKNRGVSQMTWDPARPEIIDDQIVADGGWIAKTGERVYNLYRPPLQLPGDAAQAAPWVRHVERLYGEHAAHIIGWLAFKVQFPGDKINHALVLGGNPGIGKDSFLECVTPSVGPQNWRDITPVQMLGRFNDWCAGVIVRINEANDTGGEVDRYAFFERSKQYFAAPPSVIRVDQKHIREFPVVNVAGFIITTNHKTGALYLPADDRRHFVAWSDMTRDGMGGDPYFVSFYQWMRSGGWGHVQHYLRSYDLRQFDAKGPPPRTAAFEDMVASGLSEGDVELQDLLADLGNPPAVTADQVGERAGLSLQVNPQSKKFPHLMRRAGYEAVRNPTGNGTRWSWRSNGTQHKVTLYARASMSESERFAACERLIESLRAGNG